MPEYFFLHCIIYFLTNKKEKFILTGNCFRSKQVFRMAEFVQKYSQTDRQIFFVHCTIYSL
ncbi:MAG: hypothetical protein DRI57_22005 [Deltaproteobacteria bacterium]|nr:MAG: hypothetical protein DRI57_22005 [Deltaproteobacteria bacterium]